MLKLNVDNVEVNAAVPILKADKPLRKGYRFFKPGNVDNDSIWLNDDQDVIHVNGQVLASMQEKPYDVYIWLDPKTMLS